MGFKRNLTTYKLIYGPNSDYEGLEVEMRGLTVAEALEMEKVVPSTDNPSKHDMEDLFKLFSKSIASWNIEEDDGSLTPTTVKGVKSLDQRLFLTLVHDWIGSIAHVPESLGKESKSPETSLEAQIPMETL